MNIKVLKCSICGKLQAPPVYFCKFCKSEKLEQTEVPGEGILYTYSTVHVPIAGLENEAPYTVAIVELTAGCKVAGRLVKDSSEKLSIGAAVELVEVLDGTYFFDLVI